MQHYSKKLIRLKKINRKQQGAALIVFALAIAFAVMAALFTYLDSNSIKIERDKKTIAALATAKEALIARALMDANMPGSLPCPSTTVTYDGIANVLAGNACPTYIGWYPWRTLGAGDLRDGSSERLWYALSPAYRDDTSAQPLNSDTAGTLSVDGKGDIVAIIFAPGPPISQSRPSNNAADYLEGENANGDSIYSAMTSAAINDRLITISRDEIMRIVEKKVAGEVLNCLKDYNQNPNLGDGDDNLDRHPWSTDVAAAYPSFADSTNHRFGRIPDTFANTRATSGNRMSASWPTISGLCKIIPTSGWWLNWKELVFYAVAYDKDPETSVSPSCTNDCLTIVTPSVPLGVPNLKVAVIVAGKAIGTQISGRLLDKTNISNYLEGENISTAGVNPVNPDGEDHKFEQKPATTIFNDVVVFY